MALKYIAVFILSTIVFGCNNRVNENKLPIYGQRLGVKTRTENGKTVNDTIYSTIPDFRVINQDSQVVTQKDLEGKIYVADFFFTSCPSICPITEPNLLRVQKHFRNLADFKMISFSIDSRNDSVHVLKDYATRLGADTRQWYFVRGDQDSIYTLAQKGFMASAQKDSAAPGGYVHSGAFILVDKDKRIRGIYNGTDSNEVKHLIHDIPVLFDEYHEKIK
jgi:protein SCO1